MLISVEGIVGSRFTDLTIFNGRIYHNKNNEEHKEL